MTPRASVCLLTLGMWIAVVDAAHAADAPAASAAPAAAPPSAAASATPHATGGAAPGASADGAAGAPAGPTPWLALPMMRRQAETELQALLATLDKPSRDKLVGAYVAFDPSQTDLGALAGCDDDGDYVVVLSDALLGVIDGTARAQASDKLDAYAAFVTRNARPHAKMPPAPATFFDVEGGAATAQRRAEAHAARVRDTLSGVIAHEVAHMIAGDVTCKRPTAGRESGDDTWTAGEHARSLEAAEKAYTPQHVLTADNVGTTMMLDAGRASDGLVAFLSVMDRVERTAREGYAPTYLRLHPATTVRLQWVEAAATHWRQARTANR